jgi:hypothetical protein
MWYDREDLSKVATKHNSDASEVLPLIGAYVPACSIKSLSAKSVLHWDFIPDYEFGPCNEFPQVRVL